jgi:hypothetical protein
MPKALSPQQKATVTTMLAARAPQKDIAEAASCSVSQVKRMAKNIRKWGRPVAPKLVPQGRPRALAQNVVEVCQPPCFIMRVKLMPVGRVLSSISDNIHLRRWESWLHLLTRRIMFLRQSLLFHGF